MRQTIELDQNDIEEAISFYLKEKKKVAKLLGSGRWEVRRDTESKYVIIYRCELLETEEIGIQE